MKDNFVIYPFYNQINWFDHESRTWSTILAALNIILRPPRTTSMARGGGGSRL